MNNKSLRLEILPNEIFIEIFQYFDIQQLFQSFNNLNYRFNILLRSLNNLIFKLYENNSTELPYFVPYIDTVTAYFPIHVDYEYLTNIRHLNLIKMPSKYFNESNFKFLSCLEDLSVKNMSINFAYILYKNIFSNTFPCLKSCYLSQDNNIPENIKFTDLLCLCHLQIGTINLEIYANILSVCLNLNFFKFILKSNEVFVNVKPHFNLKRIIIEPEDYIQSKNDYAINICLSFLPNLEKLYIHQAFFQVNIPYYLNSDWHVSSIDRHTPLLRYFKYELRMWHLTGIQLQIVNTIDEIKKHFQNRHNDQYRSQFLWKLTY